jgi:type IV pilus assembly protein PilA
MNAARRAGFTLLEMLVIIAIIGVLAAIGTMTFGDYRTRVRVTEAQKQFTVAVERTRNLARRFGQNYRLTVQNVTGRGSYSIVPYSADWATEVTDIPSFKNQLLPDGFTFSNTTALNVEFIGPLARSSATSACIGIQLANSDLSAIVNLVGVTGKVVSRAISSNASPCS